MQLSLVVARGPQYNWARVIKIAHPKVKVRGRETCPLYQALHAHLKGVHVHTSDQPTQLWVQYKGEWIVVPLPKGQTSNVETWRRRVETLFNGGNNARKLREHQQDLLKAFQGRDFTLRNSPAFTVYWEMGSGKTLAAIAVLLDRLSSRNVILCTNTTLDYWVEHILSTPFSNLPSTQTVMEFEVMGYTAFRSEDMNMRHVNCIVLDEAHYFRNNTQGMRNAVQLIHQARNVLLLTGTPVVNDIEDVEGMLELIDMDNKRSKGPHTAVQTAAFLKNHVSWFDPRRHRPRMFEKHYPTVTERDVRVPMTWAQTLEYIMASHSHFELGGYTVQQALSNRYNCLTRAICNASKALAVSPKHAAVVKELETHRPLGPQVVHSSLVESGVVPLMEAVQKAHPEWILRIITGTTPSSERDDIRQFYNRRKVDVLFISDASQCGVDLSGTAVMHLMEPHHNCAMENQTTARAVRMGSHSHCERKEVLKIRYVSVFPAAAPSMADIKACQDFIREKKAFGYLTDEVITATKSTLKSELQKRVAQEKETINEKQHADNIRKHALIEPYLEAFRRASVHMSTQKDATLFETTPSDLQEIVKTAVQEALAQHAAPVKTQAPIKQVAPAKSSKQKEAAQVAPVKQTTAPPTTQVKRSKRS